MTGKTVAITGCTSGTGLVAAKTISALNCKTLILLNRPSDRAAAVLASFGGAKNVVHIDCDLSSFDSVRKAGAVLSALTANDGGLYCLVLNAGVMGLPDTATSDGYDIQMQSNHLSHFLLTSEVWPMLELAAREHGEARVVSHSSGARNTPAGPLSARYLQKSGGQLGGDFWPMEKWKRYKQSKLANLLFTYALHDKATEKGSPVKALCAHPGKTLTNLQMKTAQAGGKGLLDTYILNSTMNAAHSEEDGAQGIVKACCEEGVKSGDFFGPVSPPSTGLSVLLPPERNAEGERMLWEESVKATGATFFAEERK